MQSCTHSLQHDSDKNDPGICLISTSLFDWTYIKKLVWENIVFFRGHKNVWRLLCFFKFISEKGKGDLCFHWLSRNCPNPSLLELPIFLKARPEWNMEDFFRHENAKEPPSLSCKGKLRSGTKSQIIKCLPGGPFRGSNPLTKQATVAIFYMPATGGGG